MALARATEYTELSGGSAARAKCRFLSGREI